MGYVHICNKHDWHLELGLFGCPYSPVLQAGLALGTAADRTGRGGLTYTAEGFVQLEVALAKRQSRVHIFRGFRQVAAARVWP